MPHFVIIFNCKANFFIDDKNEKKLFCTFGNYEQRDN